MTQRSAALALVALAILVVAALLFLLPGWGGRSAELANLPGQEAMAPLVQAVQGQDQQARSRPSEASVERSVVHGAGEDDPEYVAALAGFIGRVVTHEGKPAPGVQVELLRFDAKAVLTDQLRFDSEAEFEPDIGAGTVTTDAEGRFRLPGVYPAAIYLLVADGAGEARTHRLVERSPGPGEIVDLGDIELKHAAVVTGTVADTDGNPIAGAVVRAADVPGQVASFVPVERFIPGEALFFSEGDKTFVVEMPKWVAQRLEHLPIPTTLSDAGGKFRLVGIDPGANLFAITSRGHLPHVNPALRLKPGQKRDLGTIRLKDGEAATGRVVDGHGAPVVGAEVMIALKSVGVPFHFATKADPTDAQGHFSLAGFPSGLVLAAARRTAHDPWAFSAERSVNQDLLVTLPARHALTLQCKSKSGAPIVDARLKLYRGSFGEGSTPLSIFGLVPRVELKGRIEKLEDGRLRIGDLAAGRYQVTASAIGHMPAQIELDLQADLAKEVELAAELALAVVVVDGRETAVRGAKVSVQESFGGGTFPTYAGTTNAAGKLLVKCRSDQQKVTLMAMHPRHGIVVKSLTLPLAMPEARLQLRTPGSLRVKLTDQGKPPAPGKWSLVAVRHGGAGDEPDDASVPRFAVPGLDGSTVITGLPPGEYELNAVPSLRAMRSFGSMYRLMYESLELGMESRSARAAVGAGELAHVEIEVGKQPENPTGPSAHVSGSVLCDDRPAAGMVVQAWHGRRLVARVDAQGRFDLGQVAAGEFELEIIDPAAVTQNPGDFSFGMLAKRQVKLEDGADQVLTIEIRTGSLQGQVLGSDALPAPGCTIEAISAAGARISGLTDAQGRFELTRVPAGSFHLTASHHQHGKGRLGGIEVAAAQPTLGVVIRLDRLVTVQGRVDFAAFGAKRPEWVWMTFDVDGVGGTGGGESTQVAKDGAFTLEGTCPGRYRVQIWAHGGEADDAHEYEHEGVVVVPASGLRDLVIVPKPKKAAAGPEQKSGK